MRELAAKRCGAHAGIETIFRSGMAAEIDSVAASADSRHAFLRRAWFAAAGGKAPSTLLAMRRDGRMIAALPTVALGPVSLGLRAVPGSYWPYRSFPIAEDAKDAELIAFLASPVARRALGRAWRVGPVYAQDPTAARLVRLARESGWHKLQRRVATTYVFDIAAAHREGGWPRSSTLRKNRYHEKQMAAEGKVEWRFVTGGDWVAQVSDDLAAVERNAWVGGDGAADPKFLHPERRRFWEQAAADPVLARMLSAGIVYAGGTPVSFSFGLDVGPTRYCIATSYDARFAKYRPGTVVGYRTFVAAAERGVTLIDRGAGDGGHKSDMGASAGSEIIDLVFVRSRVAAALLAPLWARRGQGSAAD